MAPHDDTYTLLEYLEEKLSRCDLTMYCETFGNKNITMTSINNWKLIYENIKKVFGKISHKRLSIDVCISVSNSNKNTLTFANKKFFKQCKLEPNFKPLFSNSILNYHNKLSLGGNRYDDYVMRRYHATKFNFYSTFKNTMDVKKKTLFKSPATAAFISTNTFNCWIHGSKNKLEKIISNVYLSTLSEYKSRASKCYPYRIETRCKITNVKILIEKLSHLIKSENFSYCDSQKFFGMLDKNLNYLSAIIDQSKEDFSNKVSTPTSMLVSLLAEHITNEMYLTGSWGCNIFSASIMNYVAYYITRSENEISLVSIKKALRCACTLLSTFEKVTLLKNVVKYCPKLSEIKKFLLGEVFEMFYSGMKYDIAKVIINSYVKETTGNESLDFRYLLKDREVSKTLWFNKWAQQNLLGFNRAGKTTVVRSICNMFMSLNTIEEPDLIHQIRNFFVANKITVVIVKGNAASKKKFYSLDLQLESYVDKKKELLIQLKSFDFLPAMRISPDHSEMVRYFNAFYKYKDSNRRFDDVQFDFSYGFYPARNLDWLKNRIKYLNIVVQDKVQFEKFINDVRIWSPSSFTLLERKKYLEKFRIVLDYDQQSVFYNLVRLDAKIWNANNFKQELLVASPYDIFKAVILNATNYEIIKHKILGWNLIFEPINVVDTKIEENFDFLEQEYTQTAMSYDNECILISNNDSRHILAENSRIFSSTNDDRPGFEIDFDDDTRHQEYRFSISNDNNNIINQDCHESILNATFDYLKYFVYYNIVLNREFSFLTQAASQFKQPLLSLTGRCISTTQHDDILNSDDNNRLESYCLSNFFNRHKYKLFDLSVARKTLLSSQRRPKLELWKLMIAKWKRCNIVSSKNIYNKDDNCNYLVRFGLRLRKDFSKFVSAYYILNIIHLKFCKFPFNSSELYRFLDSRKRPSLEELERFLDCLCQEKFLEIQINEAQKTLFKYLK